MLAALVVLSLVAACSPPTLDPADAGAARVGLRQSLGGSTEGFAKVLAPRKLIFPADHGPHPDHRIEWWYFTGNLGDEQGRRYGFQLTFFRTAVAPESPDRASAWATRQIHMAHFAVVDQAGEAFHLAERFERGALGLAGATAEPFRVWVGPWSVESIEATGNGTAEGAEGPIPGEAVLPLRLRASHGEVRPGESSDVFGLELRLSGERPVVLQGDRGFSRKGPEAGNASVYYSFTRMAARGTLRLGEREVAVEGSAWMDREWSSSILGEGQVGWDWLSLQLEDGRDLMLFRLRDADGNAVWRDGTVVSPEGVGRPVEPDEATLTAGRRWTTADGRATYPVAWILGGPLLGEELLLEPLLDDQELRLTVRYWEGAVEARDRRGALRGRGYLEMTGYEHRSESP